MIKKIFAISLFCCLSSLVFAKDLNKVTVQITNVKPAGGKIVISVHNDDESFKKHIPYKNLEIENPAEAVSTIELELPAGEYAFCIFQDTNRDGELTSNKIGIPKEPFGFSNYEGKTPPGNFKKHKVLIEDDSTVEIPLVTKA